MNTQASLMTAICRRTADDRVVVSSNINQSWLQCSIAAYAACGASARHAHVTCTTKLVAGLQ